MIKEDNLGDTNKLYLTLHEVDSFYPKEVQRGRRQEALIGQRIRNKERQIENIWLAGAL